MCAKENPNGLPDKPFSHNVLRQPRNDGSKPCRHDVNGSASIPILSKSFSRKRQLFAVSWIFIHTENPYTLSIGIYTQKHRYLYRVDIYLSNILNYKNFIGMLGISPAGVAAADPWDTFPVGGAKGVLSPSQEGSPSCEIPT